MESRGSCPYAVSPYYIIYSAASVLALWFGELVFCRGD